ncbi:ABC transporter substrate-binding protein [Thermoanaerobacterium thermosaccharolyticum]|uniref:ABC transporter substrate-binding protein n=1 Tax=Thermoanaerobacterium thermosaccharolyticum TaxID=1517 RepID=UPI00123A5E46|nr:ABC transporter substrate-binding protein [Thermoanaerobacterium thermosaccharolyticum]KAA5806286.1 ABC transporter substrate-binding protein [Thermoanaerobacterium thermosaccharolyticum]
MKKSLSLFFAVLLALTFIISGCSNKASQASSNKPVHVRIGHYGGTCDAATYVAYEKGYFKKNGLDVELVKVDFNTLKDGIGTGKIDAVNASPGLFKPIEQGLNIKLVDGIHTGCIQGVVPVNSPIKSIKDLKGKTIGVDAIGGVPMVLLSMELSQNGIDPKKDVTWKVYPDPQLEQAIDKGEIDAFVNWDPFGEQYIESGKGRKIFGNNHDGDPNNQYCCFVGINGKLVKENPEVAKAIANSYAEADKWIEGHQEETAQLEVDKKYIPGDVELNAKLLKSYEFVSDKERAKKSFTTIVTSMKQQKILDPSTDVNTFVNNVFVDLK